MNKIFPTFFLTWLNNFSRVPYPGYQYLKAGLITLHVTRLGLKKLIKLSQFEGLMLENGVDVQVDPMPCMKSP